MILRHFENAKLPDGSISSTASKLSNEDFEQFMSVVEDYAGGQVLHFSRGYWRQHAADRYQRMRTRIESIAGQLEAHGALHADGAGLRGWIEKRVTRGRTNRITELSYHELLALMLSLSAYARSRGVRLELPAAVTTTAGAGMDERTQGMESRTCTPTT
jgi:hypothetical protein